MHELAVTHAILETVLRHAKKARAASVKRILLVVSELSDLQPILMQHTFDHVASETPAAGAKLEIERVAPGFTCNSCGRVFALSLAGIEKVRCTACGGEDCTLNAPADYVVEEIEVTDG